MTSLFARSKPAKPLCVARQSIVDRNGLRFGSELLFRDGVQNSCPAGSLDLASRQVIACLLRYGVSAIGMDLPLFLNCTRQTLIKGELFTLPAKSIVIEVLEGTPPDAEVLNACRQLKAAGFRIALDDYLPGDLREPLVELADFIKADLRQVTVHELVKMVRQLSGLDCLLLAEKVESAEEHALVQSLGFQLFQGYYFDRPARLYEPLSGSLQPAPCAPDSISDLDAPEDWQLA